MQTLVASAVMFACATAALAGAQEPPMAFAPPADGITVAANMAYAPGLAMDVYRPPAQAPGRPALVFFNRATGDDRHGRFYDAWARAAASAGIVAILPDLRNGSEADDFRTLMAYLTAHKVDHRIGSIAVYAGSGNVFAALPAVEDPSLTGLSAAVMYYGAAPIAQFRLDLPLLFVRAGLDRPPVNQSIASLVRTAMDQNAPVTLVNHAGGHHAFELVDNTAATREVIERTLDFVKRTSVPDYQASLAAALGEATAAGQVQTGKFREAAATYAQMVRSRPEDARLRLAYGEALLGDKQYAAACAEFDRLRDKGLGYRDLGLPAAEACLKKGDADAAIAWLASIPPQFRPASLKDDPAFAALKDRHDFQSLFVR
jgi:dienelactone hydrolase